MAWTTGDILKGLVSGSIITAIVGVIAKRLDWIRFKGKDKAEERKTESETEKNIAEIRIDEEVKISKAALEWTVQLAAQLEKSNLLNEKMQLQINTQYEVIDKMRKDFNETKRSFETKLDEAEAELRKSQDDCNEQREINKKYKSELEEFKNGTRK